MKDVKSELYLSDFLLICIINLMLDRLGSYLDICLMNSSRDKLERVNILIRDCTAPSCWCNH